MMLHNKSATNKRIDSSSDTIYLRCWTGYYSETPLFRYLADFRYLHELGHETSANLLSVSDFR